MNRKWQDYVYIQCEYKSTKNNMNKTTDTVEEALG